VDLPRTSDRPRKGQETHIAQVDGSSGPMTRISIGASVVNVGLQSSLS
jgi:hypothetical protein